MAEHGVSRLPVVERGNPSRLVGMVSLRDLLQARVWTLAEERRAERTLRLRFFRPDISGAKGGRRERAGR